MWAARTEATHSAGEISGVKLAGLSTGIRSVECEPISCLVMGGDSPCKKIFEPCIVRVLAQHSLTHIKMASGLGECRTIAGTNGQVLRYALKSPAHFHGDRPCALLLVRTYDGGRLRGGNLMQLSRPRAIGMPVPIGRQWPPDQRHCAGRFCGRYWG